MQIHAHYCPLCFGGEVGSEPQTQIKSFEKLQTLDKRGQGLEVSIKGFD